MKVSLPATRNRKAAAGAGLALSLAALIHFGWPEGEASVVPAPPAAPTAFLEPTPPPPPPPATVAPAPPPVSADGIVLRGVMGGGPAGGAAIVTLADGSERIVRVGRDLQRGLSLKSIGVSHAVLSSAGGEVRIDLGRTGATQLASASAAGGAATAPAAAAPTNEKRQTLEFQLGLQPVKAEGRIAGYSLKAGAQIPVLQRAGLRGGDVIMRVNGSTLDEERLMELAWTLANAPGSELEFTRGGRRMKVQL